MQGPFGLGVAIIILAAAATPAESQALRREAGGLLARESGGWPGLFRPLPAKGWPVVLCGGDGGLMPVEWRARASGDALAFSPALVGFRFSTDFDADRFDVAAPQGAAGFPPPLSPGGKIKLALRNSFYPVPLALSALGAGWSMWVDSDLEEGYGQGFDGFLRRWGARVAFRSTRHLVGTFAVASLLKQDPRYHPSTKKGVWRRARYAVSRVVVTRTDAGQTEFNVSNLGGIAAAAGLANTWYRNQDAGGKETAARFGLAVALDAAAKLFDEFYVHRNAPRD